MDNNQKHVDQLCQNIQLPDPLPPPQDSLLPQALQQAPGALEHQPENQQNPQILDRIHSFGQNPLLAQRIVYKPQDN